MNFLNYDPYGFMTLPQSQQGNQFLLGSPQPAPQVQPPPMMQIGQMQSPQDFMQGFAQRNQRGGIMDQARSAAGSAIGGAIAGTFGLPPQVGAMIGSQFASGGQRQVPQLMQAPQLSIPTSFAFENTPQVANGSEQYLQTLRGLLA